ncbi:hypothetical protein [uncultured Cohaesibacter sp.]|uniref:hypothetical protein n=1 Tax=uncultured Cohaesibacter sp. TaxID=1002546 RepID=UPI00292D9273|nr:hypothetical protein [uncultured Cohaesibacter sp.]
MSQNSEAYELVRLSDCPELVPLCAGFHARLSGDDSEEGLAMRQAAFQRLALDGEEEDGLVALVKDAERAGQVAGMGVLVRTDMEAFEDLGPWLTGLAVGNDDANETLRASLCREMELIAGELGYEHIFVQTEDAPFFMARGYEEVEPFEKDGMSRWVLVKALA